MLSRLALRNAPRVLAVPTKVAPKALRPLALHTSGARQKDEEEASDVIQVPTEGLLQKYGLDDWKISAPLIGALAIPTISNGVSPRYHRSML